MISEPGIMKHHSNNATHRHRFYQPGRKWDQEEDAPVDYSASSRDGFGSSAEGTSNFQTPAQRTNYSFYRGGYRPHTSNRMNGVVPSHTWKSQSQQSWRSHDNTKRWETRETQARCEEDIRGSYRADNNNWRGTFQRNHASREHQQHQQQQRGRRDETRFRKGASLDFKQESTKQSDDFGRNEDGNTTSTSRHIDDVKEDETKVTPETETLAVDMAGNRSCEVQNYKVRLQRQAALAHDNDDEGWPQIVGSCLDMCPAEEREKRARLRDLAVFERVNGDQNKTSKELAVKKFCRTFSGKDLKKSDVRPLLVLCQTMQHLLGILDLGHYPFEVVHDFLFDRTRAIRQELSMQRIINEIAVSIYENIVRFHIISERQLRQQRVSGKVFDSHLNSQQLSKALFSLLNLYVILSNESHLPNEAEFTCYYVLLNLNQPQQLSLWFQSVSPTLLETADVQFSRNVIKCYQQQNYIGFFRLAAKASYLQACLMELYFNEVRATAIQLINYGSYKLHPYPLSELAKVLLMEVEDLEEFCSQHGLAVGTNASEEVQLLSKQAAFKPPKQGLRHYRCQVIEDKRPAKLQDLFSANLNAFGGQCPASPPSNI